MKKENILILFFLNLISLSIFAQQEQKYQFLIEDLQNHTFYDGVYEPFSSQEFDYRLIRVNNSPFKKKELKNFNKIKKDILQKEFLNAKRKQHIGQFSAFDKTFSEVANKKHHIQYESTSNQVYIHKINVFYDVHDRIEKVQIDQLNTHSGQTRKLYTIFLFNYKH